MQTDALKHALRSLQPLILVTSYDAVALAKTLQQLLTNNRHKQFQIVTPERLYIETPAESFEADCCVAFGSKEHAGPKLSSTIEGLEKCHAENPKDENRICLFPYAWGEFDDLRVQRAILRRQDQFLNDIRIVKTWIFMAPSVDVVPPMLRHLFEVVADDGLTHEEAKTLLSESAMYLKVEMGEGELNEVAQTAIGMSRHSLHRALASIIVAQKDTRPRPETFKFTSASLRSWREAHPV